MSGPSIPNKYIVLLRGVNVGGKNKVPMAELRESLALQGFADVQTYIASGNILLRSELDQAEVAGQVAVVLTQQFGLDPVQNKTLVLSSAQLQSVIDNKPNGFGEKPNLYHSDAIFLIDIPVDEAIKAFKPREGVDTIWPGDGVIYSQRLSAQRTKSKLSSIMGTPFYKSMTIRSWNTTLKLNKLADGDTK